MIKPSFYDSFECKADKCTDTCCAGWEIEIDEISMKKYLSEKSCFGERIKNSIEYIDSQPCFCRDKDEKCVFLDYKGLCGIYSELGEDFLCDICREHPRFYDEYDAVVEAGLGLCCEKTCELLLDNEFELIYDIDTDNLEDDISVLLSVRQNIFEILKNGSQSFDCRIREVFEYLPDIQYELFGVDCDELSVGNKKQFFAFVVDLYEKTEPINDKWSMLIKELKEKSETIFESSEKYAFDENMYSKVMSYIIYRHFMQCRFNGEIISVIRMSLMAITFIYMCECYIFSQNGAVQTQDRINIIKFWSQQIEYSAENTDFCLTIAQ